MTLLDLAQVKVDRSKREWELVLPRPTMINTRTNDPFVAILIGRNDWEIADATKLIDQLDAIIREGTIVAESLGLQRPEARLKWLHLGSPIEIGLEAQALGPVLVSALEAAPVGLYRVAQGWRLYGQACGALADAGRRRIENALLKAKVELEEIIIQRLTEQIELTDSLSLDAIDGLVGAIMHFTLANDIKVIKASDQNPFRTELPTTGRSSRTA